MRQLVKNRYLLLVSLLSLLLVAAGDGTVLSLTVSGGGNYNETITVSTTVRAEGKIVNSNLYFEIRAPDGTVVATNSTSVPSLDSGETFSYSWSSNNGSYPSVGNYSVTLCWSPGGSSNCNIASATTTFYSVPTMGMALTIVAVGLLALWLWHVRAKLAQTGVQPA